MYIDHDGDAGPQNGPGGGTQLLLRTPEAGDGYALNRLVAASPPLDPNSVYCNLLQCTHLADTAVAALAGDHLVGFVSGYLIPARPDTLFVWQIVIAQEARGQGLAKRMLRWLLQRPACRRVSYLETTITPDNEASWGLFRSLARELDADLNDRVHFSKNEHFGGQHADEHLLRIGPFTNPESQ